MTEQILKQYTTLIEYLGKVLGPDYEIVCYDLKADGNPIVAIANGQISGREIGEPLIDADLKILTQDVCENKDYITNYQSLTSEGKILRSSTLLIKDDMGDVVGLLCVNFDETRFIELHDQILSIAHPIDFLKKYSTHTLQNMEQYEISSSDSMTEKLSSDINVLMEQLYENTISEMDMPTERLTQEERSCIVKCLQERGFFKLKGAVVYAAKKLGCSAASIYRYQSEWKMEEKQISGS